MSIVFHDEMFPIEMLTLTFHFQKKEIDDDPEVKHCINTFTVSTS